MLQVFVAVILEFSPHPSLYPAPPPAGTKMDEPLGWAHTPLDARFDTVRAAESNIGGMFADIMRISLGADAAFFNGGTIRSDQVRRGPTAPMQLLFVCQLSTADNHCITVLGRVHHNSSLRPRRPPCLPPRLPPAGALCGAAADPGLCLHAALH